jgi:hypothetical protein
MSLLSICCVLIGVIGLLKLGWAALRPLPQELAGRRQDRMEDLQSSHALHFPQLRQALATLDEDYLKRKASNETERHFHTERKQVIEGFLSGLAEDFGRLERLMKVVRKMSASEPWIQRCQRAGPRLQFRVNYRIALLLIRSEGPRSTNRLARLTEVVGNLSAQIEAGMARLATAPAEPSPGIGQHSRADRT